MKLVEVSGSGEAVLGSIQYGLAEGVPLSTPLARANGPEATVVQEGYVSNIGRCFPAIPACYRGR